MELSMNRSSLALWSVLLIASALSPTLALGQVDDPYCATSILCLSWIRCRGNQVSRKRYWLDSSEPIMPSSARASSVGVVASSRWVAVSSGAW